MGYGPSAGTPSVPLAFQLGGESVRLGDLVCFTDELEAKHDGPIMFVGRCGHVGNRALPLIDVMAIESLDVNCKSGVLWQVCHHFDD